MDLDEFGLLSILFILPYAVALQILLITFVVKYIEARREIVRMKQDAHNQQAVAAGRVYHYPLLALAARCEIHGYGRYCLVGRILYRKHII